MRYLVSELCSYLVATLHSCCIDGTPCCFSDYVALYGGQSHVFWRCRICEFLVRRSPLVPPFLTTTPAIESHNTTLLPHPRRLARSRLLFILLSHHNLFIFVVMGSNGDRCAGSPLSLSGRRKSYTSPPTPWSRGTRWPFVWRRCSISHVGRCPTSSTLRLLHPIRSCTLVSRDWC